MRGVSNQYLKIIFLLCFLTGKLFSQDIDETQEWVGIYVKAGKGKFTSRSDAGFRMADNFSKWRTLLVRTSVRRAFGNLSVLTGPALFMSAVQGNFNFTNEYRWWEEAGYELKKRRVEFYFRVRIDHRWIENAARKIHYYTRPRLRTDALLKFSTAENYKSGVLFSHELFVHHTKTTGWYLDQDRIAAGIQYYPTRIMGLQLLYLYMPLVRVNDGDYHRRQVIRLNLQLDF